MLFSRNKLEFHTVLLFFVILKKSKNGSIIVFEFCSGFWFAVAFFTQLVRFG